MRRDTEATRTLCRLVTIFGWGAARLFKTCFLTTTRLAESWRSVAPESVADCSRLAASASHAPSKNRAQATIMVKSPFCGQLDREVWGMMVFLQNGSQPNKG